MARQGAPAPTLPEPSLEVIQWPEQMPRADRTGKTKLTTGGKVEPQLHGVTVAGDFGEDVALDAAGRIVASGFTANGPDTEFGRMRASP